MKEFMPKTKLDRWKECCLNKIGLNRRAGLMKELISKKKLNQWKECCLNNSCKFFVNLKPGWERMFAKVEAGKTKRMLLK